MGTVGCLHDGDRSIRNRGGNVPIVLQNNQNNATVGETECCPTLPASMGLGGGYVPMIVMQRRFSNIIVQGTDIAPTIEAGGRGRKQFANDSADPCL